MIFSLGLFFVKKTPKFLCAVVTIINVVMIFFVINGATHDSDAYSNLYSVEFTFNQTSDISSALSTQYSKQHKGNSLQDFVVRVGYMGVCINFGDGMQCGYTSDMEYTYQDQVPSFSVTGGNKNSTSSTSLEVFDIAYAIQQKTARHQIFIVEIIFLLALLVVQLYNMIGFLPLQKYASYLSMLILGSFWIILCISITWTMVVCHDLVSVGGVMTMNILSFSKGKRSQGVLWAVFALTIVQTAYYMWTLIGGTGFMQGISRSGAKKNTDVEKDAGSVSDSVMSSITTLRGTL
ncbi:hypothetical protein PICMEDRAFT_14123 [Pichia membranifaciens NRRL Y-2026]|uniref:Uncharacterized protein n=1 Tax=Pichia membranifaciens NRRL Y-2026 TaxID=763406 RepID=A0A1E3NR56_9ASCO|nr:hypothetical protein PICMEDRAFT_14123 [Pichia membranifaciens NRRL Y-2026]ODQ48575.1 hypothetical protein PICMEDRAFT_14123 [Pichia membranifaciens NRRL Y-2026]